MFNLDKFKNKMTEIKSEMAEIKSKKPALAYIWLKLVNGQFTDGETVYGSEMQGKIESVSSGYVEFINNKPVRRPNIDLETADRLGIKSRVVIQFRVGSQLYGFVVPNNSVIDSFGPYCCILRAKGLDEGQVVTSFAACEIKGKKHTYNRVWFSRVHD